MAIPVNRRSSIAGSCRVVLALAVLTAAAALLSQSAAQAAARSADPITETPHVTKTEKHLVKMSENQTPWCGGNGCSKDPYYESARDRHLDCQGNAPIQAGDHTIGGA